MSEETVRRYDLRRGDTALDLPTPAPDAISRLVQQMARMAAFAPPGVTAGAMPMGPGGFPQLTDQIDQALKVLLGRQGALSGGSTVPGAIPRPPVFRAYNEHIVPQTDTSTAFWAAVLGHPKMVNAPPPDLSRVPFSDIHQYPQILEMMSPGGTIRTIRPPVVGSSQIIGNEVLRDILSTGLLRMPRMTQ